MEPINIPVTHENMPQEGKPTAKIKVYVDVDNSEVDAVDKKLQELESLLKEAKSLADDLAKEISSMNVNAKFNVVK